MRARTTLPMKLDECVTDLRVAERVVADRVTAVTPDYAGHGLQVRGRNYLVPVDAEFRGSRSRGLAAVDAARGTLIAYATAPGAVAADGAGENGLYTKELLDAPEEPGLTAEQVFKRVRIGVAAATRDQQIPWESSSLTGDFVFNREAREPAQVAAATACAGSPRPRGKYLSRNVEHSRVLRSSRPNPG